MAYPKTNREYRAPEISTDGPHTYNRWDALAIIHGVNAPFISQIAKDVRDEEGFFLWSSPKLVLTIAEASHAFQTGNEQHNQEMLAAAIHYCNQYLPADKQLPPGTVLKLTWAQFGIAAITCEERRNAPGEFMDIVRHGVNTVILNAPRVSEESSNRMWTADVFTSTGERFERRDNPRNGGRPQHNRRGPGSFRGSSGKSVGR